jgi:hypothetical protein
MNLPIGMLIYWAHRFSEEHATVSGMWYYKEIFVPSTIDEKRHSVIDLKNRRCTVINISGTFNQILEILMQADSIQIDGLFNVEEFIRLKDQRLNSTEKPIIFDDVYKVRGTSSIDTNIEVDTDIEELRSNVKAGKASHIFLTEDWSFNKEIDGFFNRT